MTHKVAIVTGAGSGIGKAASLALAQDGFAMVLAGRRAEPLAQVAREIETQGQRALAVPTDVANPQAVRALFERVRAEFGRLDLLFNNAGINVRAAPLEELTVEEWQSVIDINLTGAFLCTQEAVRLMKSQTPRGGRIINNGSVSSLTPRVNFAPYTASKHGILGLTKATALEGRPFDIACGQIDIGNAATGLAAHMNKATPRSDGSGTTLEAMLDLEHVAKAISYMASLPLEANVLTMTVMATKMPFVGRG
jgi:NAD(P)-dependent dehydrogenase (short-subunit alcohol dehydrogenase family)